MTTTTQIDLDALPASHLLPPDQAAPAIGTKPSVLAVWRSTGRYGLPYIKVGARVFYKAGDLRAFLTSRTRTHTGQA